ncbi:MAG: hypothetical protein ACTTKN_00130 [Phocaeicola sp.]|uniref:hypothetical protein n=1 Tax=Phocaeicola TaxID=909656 RepID=UPI00234EDDEA|nr:hypothetical protein [Phocaeicola oris]MCE2616038.1 hypothetical protein [Phocaeicola oris]
MAKRRLLKKKLSYIAGELLTASLVDGVNREKVVESVSNVLNLIPRVSHTEPGNVKGFYKTLMTDLDKEIQAVANELNKVASAK